VVFGGAVQDMTVLFLSTRCYGKSLADMIRSEMGPVAGGIAGIGILLICIIVLSVLALVVVNALKGSPWGTFTVFCTVTAGKVLAPAKTLAEMNRVIFND
jgi:carbon starvation protein CstA